MPVTCESKYIGPDYPGVTCFSEVDGDLPCATECLAVRSEVIMDEIFDDARGPDGKVDPVRLTRMTEAATEMLQMMNINESGDTRG